MWLDAFKPKSAEVQKVGIPGVLGVPPSRKLNEYASFAGTPDRKLEKNEGVPGVPGRTSGTPRTPPNAMDKTGCSSDEPPNQPNEYGDFPVFGTPGTPGTPRKHGKPGNKADAAETLAQFRFDHVQQEIDAGYPADELRRTNNIAWKLITARGFLFDEAITAAAQWVVDNPPHHDEAAFVDVMALCKGMKQ